MDSITITSKYIDIGCKQYNDQIKLCQDSYENILNYLSKKDGFEFGIQFSLLLLSSIINVDFDLNNSEIPDIFKKVTKSQTDTNEEIIQTIKSYSDKKMIENASWYVLANPDIKNDCLNLFIGVCCLYKDGKMTMDELNFIKSFL